jgi:hypothetical protein
MEDTSIPQPNALKLSPDTANVNEPQPVPTFGR